jgi:peroxiredoxin
MTDDHKTLAATLCALEKERRAAFPDIYAEVLDRVVLHLRSIGIADQALKVGDRLPPFVLPDVNGRLVSSDALLRQGPLAVGFFRGDWCPYCHVALQALADIYPAFQASGGTIVEITPDLIPATEVTVRGLNLPFSVLSDVDCAFALQCGIVYS